jgi:hypothetical protein
VRFGRTGTEAAETHKDSYGRAKRHLEDVHGDRLLDLVFHFRVGDAALSCSQVAGESSSDLIGRVTGKTTTGTAIAGQDVIRLIKN